jgi:hypothetical protein
MGSEHALYGTLKADVRHSNGLLHHNWRASDSGVELLLSC